MAGRYPLDGTFPEDSRAALREDINAKRVSRPGLEIGARIVEMAKERGLTPAQLAMLWVKDQSGVTAPIIGPRTMDHLEQMLPLLEMSFPDEDRLLFDELNPPGSVICDFHNTSGWMKMRMKVPD